MIKAEQMLAALAAARLMRSGLFILMGLKGK